MAQLGGLAGIAGLTSQVDGGQSAQRELATMQALEQSVKMDEAESLKMQEIEAAEYEKISEMSSSLLERDRNKINDKALGLQNEIRNKIREYGSKKDFYANGGLALLKGYKSDLMNSQEVSAYKENKVNLENIYKIQLAGKGHTIAPRDIKAMQDYQNGTGDRVTYSGMMSELDYPEELYNFGEDISLENILRSKDNYAKVAANYFIENPDMKGLPKAELDVQLLGFMKKMGYAAKGTDKDKMKYQAEMAKKMLDLETEKVKAAATYDEEAGQVSYLSELRGFKSQIINKEDGTPLMATDIVGKDYMSKLKADGNKMPNFIFGDNLTSNGNSYKEVSKGISNLYNADYFKLASSNNLLKYSTEGISKLVGVQGEDGSYEFQMNVNDTFKANGARITNKDLENDYLDGGDDWFGFGKSRTSAKGKIIGVHSAFKTANGDLITELYDKKGKPKSEKDVRDHNLAYKNQTAEMTMVVAIKDEYGAVIYKEIDIDNVSDVSVLQQALGVADNVTKPLKQSRAIQDKLDANLKEMNKNADNIRDAVTESSRKGFFSSQGFINEAKIMNPSSGTNDRTGLIKSFYSTNALSDQGSLRADYINTKSSAGKFQFIVEQYPELGEAIVNPSITNDKFLDLFLKNVNTLPNGKPETAETIQKNNSLVEKWKLINKTINK